MKSVFLLALWFAGSAAAIGLAWAGVSVVDDNIVDPGAATVVLNGGSTTAEVLGAGELFASGPDGAEPSSSSGDPEGVGADTGARAEPQPGSTADDDRIVDDGAPGATPLAGATPTTDSPTEAAPTPPPAPTPRPDSPASDPTPRPQSTPTPRSTPEQDSAPTPPQSAPTPTPTPTESPRSSTSPQSTPSPQPTTTPPPTATPGPTNTPAPQPTPTTQPTATPTPPAQNQTLTFHLVGGSTAVSFSPQGVTVLWASPNPGFDVEIEPESPGMKVEFRSDDHRSRIDVWWSGGPRHEIREEAD